MKYWLFAGERYAEYVSGTIEWESIHDKLEQAQMAFNFCEHTEWGEIWGVENNEPKQFWHWNGDTEEWETNSDVETTD